MPAFEEIEARLSLNADEFRDGVQGAASDLDTLEGSANSTSKAVGALGAAAAGAAAGGIAASINEFSKFQSSMVESQAIMGDLTEGEMSAMEDKAREVGRTTTFSAEQAADSFYYLSSAGLDAAESVESMGTMANFAQAGAFDMATATDILTDSASAMNMEVSEYNDLADVLVKSNTLANATVEEFGTAMKQAGGRMSDFNMSAEEGASVLSVWADQGLKGQKAGTAMNQTLRDIGRSARENKGAWEELGTSVYNSQGEFRGMETIVRELEEATAGMSQEQRNATLATLGLTDEGQRNIGMLLGQSDALSQYESELSDAGGTAQEVAEKQLQSLSAQWDLLKSQIIDIAIEIGGALAPGLERIMSVVTDVVKAFGEFNRATDGMAGALGLIGTMIGGAAVAFSAFSSSAAAAGVSTSLVTASLTGLLAPIAAVTAAIGGLAAAWKTDFAGIRSETQALRDQISGPFSEVLHVLEATVTQVTGTFRSAWQDATAGVESSIGQTVTAVREGLGGSIRDVLISAVEHINNFRVQWSMNSDLIESRISGLLTTILGIAARVREALGPAAAFVRDTFAAAWNSAVQSIIEIGGRLVDLVIRIGTRFGLLQEDTSTAASALGQLLDPFRKVELAVSSLDQSFSLMTNAWDTNWGSIRTTTTEATSAISQQFGGMETSTGTSMRGIQTTMQETLFATYNSLLTRTRETLGQVGTEFSNWMTATQGTFGMLWQIVNEILIPVFNTIVSTVRENLGAVDGIVDLHLSGLISEFLRTMTHINENIIQPILGVILAVWDRYGNEILTVVELLTDTIVSVISIAMDAIATTIRVIMAAIRGDWGEAWTLIKDFLVRTFNEIASFASEWGGRFLSWLGGLVGDVIQWFKDLAYSLIGGSVIPEMFAAILSAASGFGGDLLSWLSGMTSDFISSVVSYASDVVGEFEDMGRDALNAITSLDFVSAGKDLVSDLASGIRSKVSSVRNAAGAVADAYDRYMPGSDADTGPLSNISEYGPVLVEMFAEGLTGNLRELARAASEVAATAEPEPAARPAGVTQPQPTPAGGSGTTVVENRLDFGDLDDDDYVSVGALKQMVKRDIREENERKLNRGSR